MLQIFESISRIFCCGWCKATIVLNIAKCTSFWLQKGDRVRRRIAPRDMPKPILGRLEAPRHRWGLSGMIGTHGAVCQSWSALQNAPFTKICSLIGAPLGAPEGPFSLDMFSLKSF